MSKEYEFRLMAHGYRPERLWEICATLHTQWDFNGFPLGEEPPPEELDVAGVDSLTSGMTVDQMAARLAHVVWAANGGYCEVEVWSTFQDALPPCDIHTWKESDYRAWQDRGGPESDERDDRVQGADGVSGPERSGEDGRNPGPTPS